MKKYLIIAFIALVVILALPMTVSASTAQFNVNGTVGSYITLGMTNPSQNFGSFVVGVNTWPTVSDPVLSVTTSSTNWNVQAMASGGATNGYMYNTSKNAYLQIPFNMSLTNLPANNPGWINTTVTPWTAMSSTVPGAYAQTVYLQQWVSPTDTSAAYAITVTFTGNAN
jgi:hypothetical protein